MGRYGEKLAYVGFAGMCVSQRIAYVQPAAFLHDLTSVVMGLSIFIEGVRLV